MITAKEAFGIAKKKQDELQRAKAQELLPQVFTTINSMCDKGLFKAQLNTNKNEYLEFELVKLGFSVSFTHGDSYYNEDYYTISWETKE